MTTPDPGNETRLVDIKGRTVVVKAMNDAQIALMARESRLLQRDSVEGSRKLTGVARMFDILESMVVQEEDQEYMTDLITSGDLTLNDLLGFVTAFKSEDEKPKVRRGRPPLKRS